MAVGQDVIVSPKMKLEVLVDGLAGLVQCNTSCRARRRSRASGIFGSRHGLGLKVAVSRKCTGSRADSSSKDQGKAAVAITHFDSVSENLQPRLRIFPKTQLRQILNVLCLRYI